MILLVPLAPAVEPTPNREPGQPATYDAVLEQRLREDEAQHPAAAPAVPTPRVAPAREPYGLD